MSDRKIDLGPTGETVRKNVTRLRDTQNLTYAELSRRLKDVGNPIPPLGLRRIEAGERRVHVDDLVALAVVFAVSPNTLLMPDTEEESARVNATGIEDATARVLWHWLREGGDPNGDDISFDTIIRNRPRWAMTQDAPETEFMIEQMNRIMQQLTPPRGDN